MEPTWFFPMGVLLRTRSIRHQNMIWQTYRKECMLLLTESRHRCFITHGSKLNTGWIFPVPLMEAMLRLMEHPQHHHHDHHHQRVPPKGRSFTASAGTKAAVLQKAGLPPQTQELRLQFYYGWLGAVASRCFPNPTLYSVSEEILQDPRGTNVEVRRKDLANWGLRTSPKFTTGVKYQFHQGFWPDSRSRNLNHPSLMEHKFKKLSVFTLCSNSFHL